MKRILVLISFIIVAYSAVGQSTLQITPVFRQSGMYFSSPRITAYGLGVGGGMMLSGDRHLLMQTDVNVYWGNGNTFSAQTGIGYRRLGRWSPSVAITGGVIWGDRTEVLSDSGDRSMWPVWIMGLRIAPLRFEGQRGYLSALELGGGFGPDRGNYLEATILAVGRKF